MWWPFKKKPVAFEGAAKPIMGNFQLTAQLPNGRSIQASGYIFEAESMESLNGRLDIMQEVIERQRARCEIPELEAKREGLIDHLKGLRHNIAELTEGSRKGTLSSQENMTLKNSRTNLEHIEKQIEKGDEAIAQAKRKAGLGR